MIAFTAIGLAGRQRIAPDCLKRISGSVRIAGSGTHTLALTSVFVQPFAGCVPIDGSTNKREGGKGEQG
jgi:hypothetical protein